MIFQVLQTCQVKVEPSTDRETATKLLADGKRASDRMLKDFSEVSSTLLKTDCTSATTADARQYCENYPNAEYAVNKSFFKALSDATTKNAVDFEKYLLSCNGPVDNNELRKFNAVQEDLAKIFLLKMANVIQSPQAQRLIEAPPGKTENGRFLIEPTGRRNIEVDRLIGTINDKEAIKKIDSYLYSLKAPAEATK